MQSKDDLTDRSEYEPNKVDSIIFVLLNWSNLFFYMKLAKQPVNDVINNWY